MARKIRKVKTSLPRMFVMLLTPWVVMALVAVAAFSAGLPDYAAIIIALAAALAVTFYISNYVLDKRTPR